MHYLAGVLNDDHIVLDFQGLSLELRCNCLPDFDPVCADGATQRANPDMPLLNDVSPEMFQRYLQKLFSVADANGDGGTHHATAW